MAAIEISAGLSSLKTALDIAKALWNINDATERSSKILDLQRAIGEAQFSAIEAREAHAAQIDRIRALEEKIRSFEAWEREKERYELKSLGVGAFAYMLKPTMRGGEPPHWVCTTCFGEGKINIIQFWSHIGFESRHFCPKCKTDISPSPSVMNGTEPKWLN